MSMKRNASEEKVSDELWTNERIVFVVCFYFLFFIIFKHVVVHPSLPRESFRGFRGGEEEGDSAGRGGLSRRAVDREGDRAVGERGARACPWW